MVRRYIRPVAHFVAPPLSVIDSSSNHRRGRAEEETPGGVGKGGNGGLLPLETGDGL